MQGLSCTDHPLIQSRPNGLETIGIVARSMCPLLEINLEFSSLRKTCLYLPLETKRTLPLDTSDLRPYSNPEAH